MLIMVKDFSFAICLFLPSSSKSLQGIVNQPLSFVQLIKRFQHQYPIFQLFVTCHFREFSMIHHCRLLLSTFKRNTKRSKEKSTVGNPRQMLRWRWRLGLDRVWKGLKGLGRKQHEKRRSIQSLKGFKQPTPPCGKGLVFGSCFCCLSIKYFSMRIIFLLRL